MWWLSNFDHPVMDILWREIRLAFPLTLTFLKELECFRLTAVLNLSMLIVKRDERKASRLSRLFANRSFAYIIYRGSEAEGWKYLHAVIMAYRELL